MIRIILLAGALLCAACTHQTHGRPGVRLDSGLLLGRAEDGIAVYRGVPFAAPPVAALRWRAPQPVAPWRGVRDASTFGPSCMQTALPNGVGPWTAEFFPHNTFSEDCLYLNVWAPPQRPGQLHPIMLWIPGGGFRNGGGAVPLYDGAALAREGIVVVTLNYRLGAFGFLAHDALPVEADGSRGNYGLRDAVAALRWVHENAHALGGDPSRITIAGQSAGGGLVHLLMASPEARGLFARAIVQSSPLGALPSLDAEAARRAATRFSETVDASDATSLYAVPADKVLQASDAIGFRPHVDGVLVPADPARTLAQGRMADVPLLTGITAHETRTRLDLAGYRELAASYGVDSEAFMRLYPATTDSEALEAGLAVDRERTLAALERWAETRERVGTAPTYLYLWDRAEPGPEADQHRAFHSSELVYMFGAFAHAPGRAFTHEDQNIAQAMVHGWARFVRGDTLSLHPQPAPHARILLLGRWGMGDVEVFTAVPAEARALFDRSFDASGAFVFRE